jgi:16S rRNA processing protein RimM
VGPGTQPSYIAIARIARTRGNRGEVLADLYTDFPDRFSGLDEVFVEYPNGRRSSVVVEDAWKHKGRIVLKFKGIDDISSAEAFAGCWVMIPGDQAMALPDGTYFDHDLIGCAVEDVQGNSLGIVKDVLRITENSLLEVKGSGKEYLIPAVESICKSISIQEKRIVVDPPEGLMDLGK